jgi:predicted RNA binding protein YcfA (HicA-like mRNA interferase family)
MQRGWTIVKVTGGHGKIRSPDRRFTIPLARTPSCPYSHLNLKRDILRVEKLSEKPDSERF